MAFLLVRTMLLTGFDAPVEQALYLDRFIQDAELLKAHANDRHIGQILARVMTRTADIAYLEKLRAETRHLEVRKAAEAQLKIIREQQAEGKR